MINLFGRCAVPGVDENGTVALWNSSEVMSSVPLTKDGALDSCHLIDVTTNSSVKCSLWVYDNTYYQSSKAIEVQYNTTSNTKSCVLVVATSLSHSAFFGLMY